MFMANRINVGVFLFRGDGLKVESGDRQLLATGGKNVVNAQKVP